jgi:hypothetical protein
MAQSISPKSPQPPVFTTTILPAPDNAEQHNPIGILMTRAEIAREAWLDK